MKNPSISIGLPVYNGENYVSQAIESVLQQTYQDFELIISDNCSSDRTFTICEEYAKRDARIRLLRHPRNLGATRNFNGVFELARGRYFKWAAHDDLLAPTFLERCVEALEHHPEVVVAYSRTRIIGNDGSPIDPGHTFDESATFGSTDWRERLRELIHLRHRCFPIFGLIRSDVLKEVGTLENYSHADRILVGRLAFAGPFYRIPEYLFFSRVHEKASARLFSSPRELVAWWDPQSRSKLLLPHWRLLWEYCKLVNSRVPGHLDRVLGYAVVIRSLGRTWWRNKLVSDLKGRLVDIAPGIRRRSLGHVAKH